MHTVSAAQIKAARALLGLSRDELAEAARLSSATIRNLENGFVSYRSAAAVRAALETAGIEFTDHDGLRRRAVTKTRFPLANGARVRYHLSHECSRFDHARPLLGWA